MKDVLGEPIEVGCTICYPSRKRSKLWLRTLKVLAVNGNQISGLNRNGRNVTITRENCDDLVVAKGVSL